MYYMNSYDMKVIIYHWIVFVMLQSIVFYLTKLLFIIWIFLYNCKFIIYNRMVFVIIYINLLLFINSLNCDIEEIHD